MSGHNEQPIPRMRTIMQCVKYFKELDKDSQITYHRIRQMALKKEVPAIRSGKQGNTILINLDALIEKLSVMTLEEPKVTACIEDGKKKLRVI